MVSLNACRGADVLEQDGMVGLNMPCTDKSPIPGLILYADEGHQRLLMVQANGTVVDLLALHRSVEECIRNWHRDSILPHFVGDFKRLTPVAEILNGRKVV